MKKLVVILLCLTSCMSMKTQATCQKWIDETGLRSQYEKTGDIKYLKQAKCATVDFIEDGVLGQTDYNGYTVEVISSLGVKTRPFTIAHEFCHVIVSRSTMKVGHGKEWKACMRKYGLDDSALFNGDPRVSKVE